MSSLISVIVPAFNAEKSIHYCLDSLIRQKYRNFEVIVVNDGSMDDTDTICKRYSELDNRFKVINKKNEGPSVARNVGVQEAKGEYILFVDSDDFVSEDYISSFLEAKSLYPEYEHIWCTFQTVTDYGGANAEAYPFCHIEEYSLSSKKEFVLLYEKWLTNSPCNKLYKREMLLNFNLKMKETISLGEDLIFNLEYLDSVSDERILIINTPTYNYVRNGSESLDNKYRPDLFEIYEELNKAILFYLIKWKIPQEQMKKFYSFCYWKIISVLKNTFHKFNKQSFLSKLKYNNQLLKKPEVKMYFEQSKSLMHQFYWIAFKSNNYVSFLILDWLNIVLRKLKSR